MDKRLVKLLQSGKIGGGKLYALDTYSQQVHEDFFCTIRTNINTANHHFIFERIEPNERDNTNRNLVSNENGFSNPQRGRVYDTKGIAPCLDNLGGGGREVKIVESMKDLKEVLPLNADEQGLCRPLKAQCYKNGRANFLKSDGGSFAATGVIEYMKETKYIEQMSSSQNSRVVDPNGISYAITNGEKDGMPKIIQNAHGFNKGGEHIISPTITGSKFQDNNVVRESEPHFRIRKLTPRECFRLMGVDETDIDKIQQSWVSHTQQYKMAGNSIVVDCLYHLFRKMFVDKGDEAQQMTLF